MLQHITLCLTFGIQSIELESIHLLHLGLYALWIGMRTYGQNFFFFNLTWYDIYRVGWLLKSLTGKFLLRYSTFWTRKRQFFTTKFKIINKKWNFFLVFFKKGPEVINYCAEVNGNIGRPLTCYFSLISWDSIPPKYWMVWYSDQQWGEFKEGQRK